MKTENENGTERETPNEFRDLMPQFPRRVKIKLSLYSFPLQFVVSSICS